MRRSTLDRPVAMRLAAEEYDRYLTHLRSLDDAAWARPTDCPGWDVRAMACHLLGMAEMSASLRENMRQVRAARRGPGVFIDNLTALQVAEHASMAPAEIVARYAAVVPRAVRGRRRTPALVRRRPIPEEQIMNGRAERWSLGYLIDTILTRDPWMHRIDSSRATGRPLVLTAEHDGAIVADVVAEWAERHGRPYALHLTGPAGGQWKHGADGPHLELDAIEFCRVLSGRAPARAPAPGLLTTEVPF